MVDATEYEYGGFPSVFPVIWKVRAKLNYTHSYFYKFICACAVELLLGRQLIDVDYRVNYL